MRPSTRDKRLCQSQRFLRGIGTARAYGVGEIGPDPRRTRFFILSAVVAVALVAFVFYSSIVFPGLFLIWAVYVAVERSTCVVVTDEGLAILARSEFNGRPRKFVALLPSEVLADPTIERSGRYVHLPTYSLWLREKEHAVLTRALLTAHTSAGVVLPRNGGPAPVDLGTAPPARSPPRRPPTPGCRRKTSIPRHHLAIPNPAGKQLERDSTISGIGMVRSGPDIGAGSCGSGSRTRPIRHTGDIDSTVSHCPPRQG